MTSRDIYHRIRWDGRLDAAGFTVGYNDRFRGLVEVNFLDSKWQGDVPWHRVQHFSYQGTIVWNREGLNLLDTLLQEPAPSSGEKSMRGWDGGWVERPPQSLNARQPLKILTWNVLSEDFHPTGCGWDVRWAAARVVLETESADVVVLCEVTEALLRKLQSDLFIRRHYHLTDDVSLQPYGQLILSKIPGVYRGLELQNGKKVVQCSWGGAVPLTVVGVHLLSDGVDRAQLRREEQLAEILAYHDVAANLCVLGDFNQAWGLEQSGLVDCWSRLWPGASGHTFDPWSNGLARLTSKSGKPRRLDRIMLRGGWTATEACVLETSAEASEEVSEVVSDHCPLLAVLAPPETAAPVVRSALAVIPPEELWHSIQAVRREHDKSYQRWMPHINLLYGFVPEDRFDHAIRLLRGRLRDFPTFRVRLKLVERFEHGGSTTMWLHPECDPPEAWERLHQVVAACFPGCGDRREFVPHLTIASIPKGRPLPRLPSFELSFEVDALSLICRGEETPFEVRGRVTLRRESLGELPPAAVPSAAWPLVERLAVEHGASAVPVGSQGLDLGLPWSDLDVCWNSPHSPEELEEILPGARLTPGRHPVLRLNLARQPVDLQLGGGDQAVNDMQALRSLVSPERLIPLLRVVRTWAHARCLDKPAFGFPGGWAWALLTAHFLNSGSPPSSLMDQLTAFFAFWSQWEWPRAVVMVEAPSSTKGLVERMPVYTLTEPFQNAAPNVTESTLHLLTEELLRAEQLSRRGLWSELVAEHPVGSFRSFAIGAGSRGEIEGSFLTLLLRLEREGRPVRILRSRQEGDKAVFDIQLYSWAQQEFVQRLCEWSGERWSHLHRSLSDAEP